MSSGFPEIHFAMTSNRTSFSMTAMAGRTCKSVSVSHNKPAVSFVQLTLKDAALPDLKGNVQSIRKALMTQVAYPTAALNLLLHLSVAS